MIDCELVFVAFAQHLPEIKQGPSKEWKQRYQQWSGVFVSLSNLTVICHLTSTFNTKIFLLHFNSQLNSLMLVFIVGRLSILDIWEILLSHVSLYSLGRGVKSRKTVEKKFISLLKNVILVFWGISWWPNKFSPLPLYRHLVFQLILSITFVAWLLKTWYLIYVQPKQSPKPIKF